jgi:hypothetical protein
MNVKRFLAAVLAAALSLSLMVLPAGAAPGSFSDITDQNTALNADILRLMGIVSGVGDNQFNPGGTLTRAQFCTMAVSFLQKRDEAARYATRTIFSDVGSTHWARSFINFAAAYQVGGGSSEEGSSSGSPLVSGVGDGRFLPDENITLAEAATILLRTLGYTGKQAGAVWPQGYIDLGRSVHLLDGLYGGALDPISRAEAAQLFVNALNCETAGGEVYYKSLGEPQGEKSIVLAVNVTTDDGSRTGAVRVVTGASVQSYLPAQGEGNPVSLQGRRGQLVLNDRKEIVTFLPDNSTRITAVLDGKAGSGSFKGEDGKRYTVDENTPVYVADAKENSGYKESVSYETAHKDMVSGTQVTMYAENGKIVTLFAATPGVNISTDAVVIRGNASAATFHQLTGGRDDFTIRRGRETIRLGDLKDYDVVTYDKSANALIVSDLRLSCVYGAAAPSPKDVEKITLKVGEPGSEAKTEFDVLESAWNTTNDFKPGDSVVLLLTADGKVAGMASPNSKVRSNAVGEISGDGVKIFRPDGGTLDLKGTPSNTGLTGLVTVSANKTNLSVSRLSSSRAPGDYQVSDAKLGDLRVASDVRVYERANNNAMAEVKVDELPAAPIPADKIAAYRQNSSGIVDFIVLEAVTGNAYEYGMMVSGTVMTDDQYGDHDNNPDTPDVIIKPGEPKTIWKLLHGNGKELKFVDSVGYSGKSGDMVGVIAGNPKGDGEGKTLAAVIKLTEVKNVKSSDFFTSQDGQYVTTGGQTYRVASDVECCHSDGGSRPASVSWLDGETGADRLNAIRAYSDDLTIYVDPVGRQVRIIKAN